MIDSLACGAFSTVGVSIGLPYLSNVTEKEVSSIIGKMPNKLSYGHDEIPPALIKVCCEELTPLITSLINQSFDEECFPDQLKIAKIKPIFK